MGSSKLDGIVTLWRRKCGDRLMPSRADFDVFDLRPWLGHISLCDVVPADAGSTSGISDEFRFRLRLQGTHLVDAHAADYTGRFLDEAFPVEHLEPLLRPLRRCVVTRRPVSVSHEGRDLRGRFRRSRPTGGPCRWCCWPSMPRSPNRICAASNIADCRRCCRRRPGRVEPAVDGFPGGRYPRRRTARHLPLVGTG